GWKISGDGGAASILDIPSSTLRSKMNRLGIARPTMP
ncbi:MAG: AAA family ATPase, partial [Gammaproteobacteria bacterium]|nr:AAA family ATPase [Gammaproteobacteria bacterium]